MHGWKISPKYLLNIFIFFNVRAPTDCVQYFTGTSGSIQSYNHQGSQFLQGQDYQNCIRTEAGYCKIQWKQASTTSPDPFGIGPTATLVKAEANDCPTANFGYLGIPSLSPDGVVPITGATLAFQDQVCGSEFGIDEATTSATLVCKFDESFGCKEAAVEFLMSNHI